VLDDGQREAFARDGFVVLGRIADDGQVQSLLDAEARFRPRVTAMPDGSPIGLLLREQLCHRSEAVRRFCLDGAHVPAVVDVLGPDVAFTHTQFITKLPEEAGEASWIPLHQDDGYGELDPPLDVTVWTALTDTTPVNGCLVVVPGSHRAGVLDHDPTAANPWLREVVGDPSSRAVEVPLAAGEAVLFTGLTVHGSGPNRSGAPRVGMHARYCHPSVKMVIHGRRPVLDDPHSWMVAGEATR